MSVAANQEAWGFESFMERNLEKDLLRFTTAGSVDDGKSTLIGRLLHDSKSVFEDQLAAVKKSRINRSTGALDFSLLTDGLRAEREQGITIDVAYRYFETPRRKFIIADTPGHEQYTRNMATGASTANLAVILIDSTKGVLAQTRRHTYIASLLGIPNVLVAINKMDLVDYSEEIFLKLQKDFDALAKQLAVPHVVAIPISALAGENVVERGSHMPWYHGPTFLEHLETVPIRMETPSDAVRFPVQYVIRPDASFRGFAGPVASGVIRPGDSVVSLPSEQKSRVRSIVTFDGDAPEAFPPMSVTLTLEDEIDLSRGDMLVSPAHAPRVSRHFDAMLVWFNAEPAEPGKSYLLKHTSRTVRAKALKIHYRVNVNTLVQEPASSLQMNDIAYVEVETVSPLFFDPYTQNRITGSFILIDPISNATLGAGMIRADLADQTDADRVSIAQEYVPVAPAERYKRHRHNPGLILVENNPRLATRLERALFDDHFEVLLMSGDALPASVLESRYAAFESAGLVVIYACAKLATEAKNKLRELAGDRFFDLSALRLPAEEDEAVRKILSHLQSLRAVAEDGNRNNVN
ncbi:MAG TPA: sulfate adenylyltransferase subunit CysN [Candidatus Acidoferrales bacterium]|jgi:sulfate adenylyltransferase large subunit|nr:sulfate adenylyltransferase subunit CysN [Candidatus Acidoferrales bacterium]